MPSATRWATVALLIGAGMIAAFQVGKAAVAVPALRDDLGLSLLAAASVVGAMGAVGAAVGLPAGLLMSVLPARRLLLAGLIAIGCGSIVGGFADSGAFLIATRIFEGCGFLCVTISAPRLMLAVTSELDRQAAFAFWGIYMPGGTAIMMLAGPILLSALGWRALWWFNGALPIAYAGLIASLSFPAVDAQRASRLAENLRSIVRSPGPALIALAFGFYTFQYFALAGLLPALLVERLGLSIAAAGLLSAAAVAANALGNLFAGALLRLGVPLWSILALGFIVSGVASLGIFADAVPIALVAAFAGAAMAITGLVPASVFAAAPMFAANSAALAVLLGLTTQLGISGQLLGPPVLGAFVERYGWSAAPLIFLAVMAAGLAIALVLGAALRRRRLTAP